MKTVIIGAGFTGVQLARRLINEKNDVVLIDRDEEVVSHISNRLDCTVLQADGNNLSTLEDAGIAKADAMVCLTNSDEVNMITCSLVERVYPDILKVARVRNYAYYANSVSATRRHAEVFTQNSRPIYGIDFMIHPDVEAAKAIVNAVEHGAIMESLQFGDSGYELVRITVEEGSIIDGQQLKDIRELTQKPFLAAYVESDFGSTLPTGTTVIRSGDRLGLLLDCNDIEEIAHLCGSTMLELKRIVLVGAGKIGTIVAQQLLQAKSQNILQKIFGKSGGKRFMIIDSDAARSKAAAQSFPQAQVSKADITDEGFVEEENISEFDLAISTTGNYELNMVISAYLESLGVKKTVALVSSTSFSHIARMLGVDVAVPIRDAVVDSIISHLRGSAVMGIHTVSGGGLEIIECVVSDSSKFVGLQLKDIDSKGAFLVLLTRGTSSAKYQIAKGITTLNSGDHIVVIAPNTDNAKVIQMFSGQS